LSSRPFVRSFSILHTERKLFSLLFPVVGVALFFSGFFRFVRRFSLSADFSFAPLLFFLSNHYDCLLAGARVLFVSLINGQFIFPLELVGSLFFWVCLANSSLVWREICPTPPQSEQRSQNPPIQLSMTPPLLSSRPGSLSFSIGWFLSLYISDENGPPLSLSALFPLPSSRKVGIIPLLPYADGKEFGSVFPTSDRADGRFSLQTTRISPLFLFSFSLFFLSTLHLFSSKRDIICDQSGAFRSIIFPVKLSFLAVSCLFIDLG